jgi:hypothetical protein
MVFHHVIGAAPLKRWPLASGQRPDLQIFHTDTGVAPGRRVEPAFGVDQRRAGGRHLLAGNEAVEDGK